MTSQAASAPLEITSEDVTVFETTHGMPGICAVAARRGKIVIVDNKKVCDNGNGIPKN